MLLISLLNTECCRPRSLTNMQKLTFFLVHMGHGSDLFFTSQLCMVNMVIFQAIVDTLRKAVASLHTKYIVRPGTPEEVERVEAGFYTYRAKFPRVIGAIDGTIINIQCPSEADLADSPGVCPIHFLDWHGRYSMMVLAMCDHNGLFQYFDVRHPGSCRDSMIFLRSVARIWIRWNLGW